MRRSLRIVISAGPTREPLDPVRFISNYSTGVMGACLAGEALRRGHRVTVVSGPGTVEFPLRARVVGVERAREMEAALRRESRRADAIIMAAAVADFQPLARRASKLARRGRLVLTLRATPDIIGRLPKRRRQLRAGFALETGRSAVTRALEKMREKQLDVIVAQRASAASSPFGRRPVRAWLIGADGAVEPLGLAGKPRVARALLDKMERLWYRQPEQIFPTHVAKT